MKLMKNKQKKRLQNYYECMGCGNCVDVVEPRGKCELCGTKLWQPKTTYTTTSENL